MAARQKVPERAEIEKGALLGHSFLRIFITHVILDISRAASIAPSTIKATYREMLQWQTELLPENAMLVQ